MIVVSFGHLRERGEELGARSEWEEGKVGEEFHAKARRREGESELFICALAALRGNGF